MNRSIKLAGLVTGVSLAAVVAGVLVAAQQSPDLASASGDVKPIDSSASTPTVPTPSTKPSGPPGTAGTTPTNKPTGNPAIPVKLTLDLTKLKQGDAPKTPYVADRTVHFGDTEFTLPASDGGVWDVVRAGAGSALVLHSPKNDGTAVLTTWSGGSRGATVKSVNSVASSADRTTSAYTVQPTAADGSELPRFTVTWRDNPSGETMSLQRTGESGPIVRAVIGSEVYFSALGKNSKETLYVWTAGSDQPRAISAVPTPSAVSSDGQLAAGVVSQLDDGSCTAVVDLASAKKRWSTCKYAVDELPGAGDFALGGPAYRDGYGDGVFAALDVRNGKLIREWSGGSAVAIVGTVLEDADHILTLAEQGNQTAIVRCAPKTGTCELAAPLKNGTGHDEKRPYQLGH
ncbi:hypothetical protein OG394_03470 [Kribbella sp. NBC_01245]|uniref:hypothetical protein n=1 Tax=Kribbella sp. NBC_01245 TaxID=2903578 RepID=UPI002E2A50DD|nr:hypothetical protein [Kribbella sp. NBC_01245]